MTENKGDNDEYRIINLKHMEMAEFVKKHRLLLYLPILISAPLLYTSQWTHLIYWFSPENLYNGADNLMRYFPYMLFFLYVVMFVGVFMLRYTRYGTAERKGIMISVIAATIGYHDENDFPNKLESWSDLLYPDDRARVLKEYNDTIQDYSGEKNYDVEYRLRVKNGEWRWFHAIGRLLRRENGVPLSYVGMFVDITDKKAAGILAV